jgi:cytosine/creatinine deaminase
MQTKSWNLKNHILNKIKQNGGWSNCHAHIDRAFTLTEENFNFYQKYTVNQKWHLHNNLYTKMTVEDLVERMSLFIEMQIASGVTNFCSYLNSDPFIENRAFLAGEIVKNKYKNKIDIKFAVNHFKSFLSKEGKKWLEIGAEYADIIGGTPRSDIGQEDKHLDVVFEIAKKMNKTVMVHVDELHREYEKETELLCDKTREYGLENRVWGVHGVSLSRQNFGYRQKVYQKMSTYGVGMVVCPTAWLDHRRSEELMPFHNSIFPVEEAVAAGVTVAIGTDNVFDYTLPFGDGDMWTELRTIAHSCRFTDVDELVKIASVNGKKALGLQN